MNTFGIYWQQSQYILLLAIIISAAGLLLTYNYFWQKRTAQALVSARYADKFLLYFSLAKNKIKIILYILCLLFLAAALMRPQWGNSQEIVNQEGRDLLIALDISRSMLAEDIKPSRLECAKQKIKEIISALGSIRAGLILFSGDAFLQVPLTYDLAALFTFLDAVNVESISSGTTALDKAVITALETFKNMPTKKNKLLLLFTDGEDFSSSLDNVEKESKQMGLRIFTIGMGTREGAPIPVIDAHNRLIGHQKDAQGNIIISRLNEQLLFKIAQSTGANYIKYSENTDDINQLIDIIKRFEKEKFEQCSSACLKDRYYIFGFISLLCLVLEWLL